MHTEQSKGEPPRISFCSCLLNGEPKLEMFFNIIIIIFMINNASKLIKIFNNQAVMVKPYGQNKLTITLVERK